jgi:hypothetical protein
VQGGFPVRPEVGDELVVDGLHVGEPARKGETLEVRVDDGREHYLIRWDDNGHETLFFPGPTPHVLRTHRDASAKKRHEAPD